MGQQKNNITKATKNVWGANPAGSTHASDHMPGTKEFFEKVLKERFTKEHDFLIELVDYPSWKNKRVLEIGCGAGYDAYMFCKNGADYTGIDLVPENIIRTQKHLNFYGLKANILEVDAIKLHFDKKFDLIYSFGVLHHIPEVKKVLKSIKSNLAKDGILWIAVYNKRSWFYWVYLYLFRWLYLGERHRYKNFTERLASIEFTQSGDIPYVTTYTKKTVSELLRKGGFEIVDLKLRKFTREDIPVFPYIEKLYKYLPQALLNFLAKHWGWYLCVQAKKVM